MTKRQLLLRLKKLQKLDDCESAHAQADDLLIEYISDEKIKRAFGDIKKWYS